MQPKPKRRGRTTLIAVGFVVGTFILTGAIGATLGTGKRVNGAPGSATTTPAVAMTTTHAQVAARTSAAPSR